MDSRKGAVKKTISSKTKMTNATAVKHAESVWKTLAELGCTLDDPDWWDGMELKKKPKVYEIAADFIYKKELTDFEVRIGDKVFECHLILLQALSEYFMECTSEDGVDLPEEEVTAQAFQLVYDWMLTDEPFVQIENLLIMYKAAQFLRIDLLCDQIWSQLDDSNRFSEKRAWRHYLEACQHQMPSIQMLMLGRIQKFFLTLVASDQFLDLSAVELTTLLSRSNIAVNTEMEVFFAIVRWLNADWDERQQHLVAVMDCVRFGLMPGSYLLALTIKDDPNIKPIISNSEVKEMINRGLEYNSIKMYHGDRDSMFVELLDRLNMTSPAPRCWAYDKTNPAHHKPDCHKLRDLEYQNFVGYLDFLRTHPNAWSSLEVVSDPTIIQCCPSLDDVTQSSPRA